MFPASDCGDCGCVRFRQIVPGVRRSVCRGLQALSGIALYLYEEAHDRSDKAQVDEVRYVPAALALHQRPGIPGIRSTFGTGTEL